MKSLYETFTSGSIEKALRDISKNILSECGYCSKYGSEFKLTPIKDALRKLEVMKSRTNTLDDCIKLFKDAENDIGEHWNELLELAKELSHAMVDIGLAVKR